ncbi:hypothetical protein [uncultured Gammaproteobacteria bacterium]|nr:hypothetical protein [uncultured Gammaproteobacteria bacterium]CAC9981958.1 hypothetical protein [uncultured Gammaproteobacteria bacterium]
MYWPNKRIHSDKTKLRHFALRLYFSSDVRRYALKKENT